MCWQEEEEEFEAGDSHDQGCGAGLQAMKDRLSGWCLTGQVYRPREETYFGRLWILLITVICAYKYGYSGVEVGVLSLMGWV